jgi:hypothetical protein
MKFQYNKFLLGVSAFISLITRFSEGNIRNSEEELDNSREQYLGRISKNDLKTFQARYGIDYVNYLRLAEPKLGEKLYAISHEEETFVDLYCLDCDIRNVNFDTILLAVNNIAGPPDKPDTDSGKPAYK